MEAPSFSGPSLDLDDLEKTKLVLNGVSIQSLQAGQQTLAGIRAERNIKWETDRTESDYEIFCAERDKKSAALKAAHDKPTQPTQP